MRLRAWNTSVVWRTKQEQENAEKKRSLPDRLLAADGGGSGMKARRLSTAVLLGLTATLAAVAGARAEDLDPNLPPIPPPVAKVDPNLPPLPPGTKAAGGGVKVCSLYGEGFSEIPGVDDTCFRAGATARLDGGFNADGNGGPFIGNGADARTIHGDSRDFVFQGRGIVWLDARRMTQYGVLKAYISGGFDASTGESPSAAAFLKRGYLAFAGITLGKTQSFFDFLNGAFSYGSYHLGGGSNTYDNGTLLAAYTYDFGLGISATGSIEDNGGRRNAVWDAGTNPLSVGSFPGPNGTSAIASTICSGQNVMPDGGGANISGCPIGDYKGRQIPDLVANLRIDQGWGSGQIAGALHQVRAGFYGDDVGGVSIGPSAFTGQGPADRWGFALMGGIMANVPTGESDRAWANIVFADGAIAYTGLSQINSFGTFSRFSGSSAAAGWALDGVFANTVGPAATGLVGSGIQLTKAWSVGLAYEHRWNGSLRSSVFGVLTDVTYPGEAQTIFCSSPAGPVRTAGGGTPNFSTGPVAGCNPDFVVWGLGTRTVWNPMQNLDLGAEVMYSRIEQNMGTGVLLNFAGTGGAAAGNYTPASLGTWSGLLRLQWHFGSPPTEESRS
jgi:hypothetical protein